MEKITLRELAVPMIKAIDTFNYLLKSHHRRTAIISYHIGKKLGLSNEDVFELIVSASLHDIGALSVQERNMLIQQDVVNPEPHCEMGFRMLSTFDVFSTIAKIVRHHHIHYQESLSKAPGEVIFSSHIIHLADRVEILISKDEFILNQKQIVIEKIRKNVGTIFHPEVFTAFEQVAKADIFWLEINNLKMEELFNRIDVSIDFELTMEMLFDFSFTLARFIDFRSKFTAAHSYTVGQVAGLIGSYYDYPEEKKNKLMIAGYLHDIGKIGIDPGLLEKEGKLSEEDYNLVKLHAYYTAEILKELGQSAWFKDIIGWAAYHHEKIDGSGYPYSLSGEDITEEMKILAFSDIISSFLEDRPYRGRVQIDKVFEIIEETIASRISIEMFREIKHHMDKIESLIIQCQKNSFSAYYQKQ